MDYSFEFETSLNCEIETETGDYEIKTIDINNLNKCSKLMDKISTKLHDITKVEIKNYLTNELIESLSDNNLKIIWK